jgi:hypothetical protein
MYALRSLVAAVILLASLSTALGDAAFDRRVTEFATMGEGLKAAALDLLNHHRLARVRTIRTLVWKYDPSDIPEEKAYYIANLSAAMGVEPEAPLRFTNRDTLRRLLAAVVREENGLDHGRPYFDDETLARAVDQACESVAGQPPPGSICEAR